MNRKVVFAIILAAILISTVLAVTYILVTSNTVGVNVTSGTVSIPVVLTSNTTACSDLDTVQLTATITNVNGVGLLVYFRDGSTIVGSTAIVDNAGTYEAIVNVVQPSPGSHSYTAGP